MGSLVEEIREWGLRRAGSVSERGGFLGFLDRFPFLGTMEEIFYTLREAQILIEDWRREYNEFRPHSSLGYRPPAPVAFAPEETVSASLRRPLRPHLVRPGLT